MTENQSYRPDDVQHYPLHMLVSIVPPSRTDALIGALEHAGVASTAIDLAYGIADAQRIIDATEESFFGRVLGALAAGEEQHQRQTYVDALRQGAAVVRVRVASEAQKQPISAILADHGGSFINYYGRWVVESLMP